MFVDEESTIWAGLLCTIHSCMGDISGNFDDPIGGMNTVFCGDKCQLPGCL